MTHNEIVTLMRSSRSPEEWKSNEERVKAHFSGSLPSFWYGLIVQSEVAKKTKASWPKPRPTQPKRPSLCR